jgi:hypothetical protein
MNTGMDPSHCPSRYSCIRDLIFFAHLLKVRVHLHHSSKIKVIKKSQKTVEILVFLTIFAWRWKDPDPDPYLWLTDPDPGGPKSYGSGPEHWLLLNPYVVSGFFFKLDHRTINVKMCCIPNFGEWRTTEIERKVLIVQEKLRGSLFLSFNFHPPPPPPTLQSSVLLISLKGPCPPAILWKYLDGHVRSYMSVLVNFSKPTWKANYFWNLWSVPDWSSHLTSPSPPPPTTLAFLFKSPLSLDLKLKVSLKSWPERYKHFQQRKPILRTFCHVSFVLPFWTWELNAIFGIKIQSCMILCTEDGYEPKTEVKQLPVAIMKTCTCCIYPHPDPIWIQGIDDQKLKKIYS